METKILELLSLLVIFLPTVTPLLMSIARFYAASTRHHLIYRAGLIFISYGISVAMTSQAYHIGTSYKALPQTNDFLSVGLVWALVATLPAILAIILNNKALRGAALAGATISFVALIFLTPVNYGLIIMFSFE